jgi:hypothetical protein
MNEKLVEVLTKVYVYVNRIKVELALEDIDGVWSAVNALSDYLVSVDVGSGASESDRALTETEA